MPKVANTSPQFTDTMALVPASFIPAVKAWKFGAAQGAEGGVKSFPLTCGGSELMLQMQGCISPFDASDPPGGSSSRKTLTTSTLMRSARVETRWLLSSCKKEAAE